MKKKIIDQSQNGVTVIVTKLDGHYSSVVASCHCFGSKNRTHSRIDCPNNQRIKS